MNTKALLTILSGILAGLSACRSGEVDTLEPPVRFVDIPVSLAVDTEPGDTRSTVDISVERFQKAALFAFDAATGLLLTGPSDGGEADTPVVAFSSRKTFSWSLPAGKDMDIYTLVNYGELDLESFAHAGLHRSELEKLTFVSRSPSELKELETEGYGLPMAGVRHGVRLSSGEGLTLTVRKLYAKFNLYFDLSQVEAQGWQVQAMHMIVENANSEVPYFVEGYRQEDPSKLVQYDRATEKDLDEIQQGGNAHMVTLYMLENCQGHKEGAESWKTVYKDLGFEAVRNCTYIDLSVKVQRASGEYQDLGYAIYLGKTDMRSDFDIQRNLFKTVKIVLPGPDDPTPASRFFRFTGTESPTVSPGESLELFFVTNLSREDLSVSFQPEGLLALQEIRFQEGEDGIGTGSLRLLSGTDLEEGTTCRITAGAPDKQATDQRTVTASWPTVLEVDLSEAPAYVAQAGFLSVIPEGGIIRVDAEVKAGSEDVLEVRQAGVSGSTMNIALAGLSVGTGTVILHHFNTAGVEVGSQEVDIPIQAPRLRFGMDLYRLSPDGTVQNGMLFYQRPDGTAFSQAELDRFDPDLVRRLLFPTSSLDISGCGSYVEGTFIRDSADDRRRLTIPISLRVKRLYANNIALQWEEGEPVGQVFYAGAPSTHIPAAEADLEIVNPLAALAGTCLGVIENNLPVHEALSRCPDYLKDQRIPESFALGFKSYRNGNTFKVNGSELSLQLTLPVSIQVPCSLSGPEEFAVSLEGNRLTLTAREHPARYTGYGHFSLQARIQHAETKEWSAPVDAGYLEIYLIGAVGPYIHGREPYVIGGGIVPEGDRSPIAGLSGGIQFGENTVYTDWAMNLGTPMLYRSASNAVFNLYYQYVDTDNLGIDRYAADGDTFYLNSYKLKKGYFDAGTDVMEFRFGYIYQSQGHEILTAASECDRMVKAFPSYSTPKKGNLLHFSKAGEKDAEGYSYCAVVNLFGGNGGRTSDTFISLDGQDLH